MLPVRAVIIIRSFGREFSVSLIQNTEAPYTVPVPIFSGIFLVGIGVIERSDEYIWFGSILSRIDACGIYGYSVKRNFLRAGNFKYQTVPGFKKTGVINTVRRISAFLKQDFLAAVPVLFQLKAEIRVGRRSGGNTCFAESYRIICYSESAAGWQVGIKAAACQLNSGIWATAVKSAFSEIRRI